MRSFWGLFKPIIELIPSVGSQITGAIDQSGIGAAIDSAITGAFISAIGKRDLSEDEFKSFWNLLQIQPLDINAALEKLKETIGIY